MDIETILNLIEEPPEGKTAYYSAEIALNAVEITIKHFLKGNVAIGFEYYDHSYIPVSANRSRDSYFVVGIKEIGHLEEKIFHDWVDRYDFEEKLLKVYSGLKNHE